jgi:hypothetical protein
MEEAVAVDGADGLPQRLIGAAAGFAAAAVEVGSLAFVAAPLFDVEGALASGAFN